MADSDDVAQLKVEWDALFARTLALGRTQGQQRASEVLRSAMDHLSLSSVTQATGVAVTPVASAPSAQTVHSPQGRKKLMSGRAASGSVRTLVDEILGSSPVPLTPRKIGTIGLDRGQHLKDSSIRMALQTLRDIKRARQVGNGEWETMRPASGASGAGGLVSPQEGGSSVHAEHAAETAAALKDLLR